MRVLHVHIRMLRKKIEDDPNVPQLIQTVRNRGYRFVVPDVERIF
jgi:DNA-binding response OmpR family regulator